MKIVNIKEKLTQLGVQLDDIVLGDFDYLGKFCAERTRERNDANYKKYGFSYRSNYERGMLAYYLVRQLGVKSFLEIGTGRGYVTFCVAKAMYDSGISGRIVTVDPAADENFFKALNQVFPQQWFKDITFVKGFSGDVVPTLNEKFDFVYIDGDHSYMATKIDWEMCKDKFNQVLLFDDYHLPTKIDPGIQCREVIDSVDENEVDCNEKELIIMDRRIFVDERGFTDEQINYGQCLLTKKSVNTNDDW